ncbi:MAG TPA: T9SS type A sorting domain-containing protein [Cytophagales bacterium]|nr:T9SS type A sorting domain-containing protein [Cytophagales bacterium]
MYDWHSAGLDSTVQAPSRTLNIDDYGAIGNDTLDDQPAFVAALSECNYQDAVILVAEGTYVLNKPIYIGPNSRNLIFRGISSKSIININSSQPHADAFTVAGKETQDSTYLTKEAFFGQKYLICAQSDIFEEGQDIHITVHDTALIKSSWAYRSIGMINQISSISSDTIFLRHPLSIDLPLKRLPLIRGHQYISHIGFECLTLNRLDKTTTQTANIRFIRANNCWVTNIESNRTNFAHIGISQSRNLYIGQNYFHHSHEYSEGGKGYGISTDLSTNLVLVENNILSNLRHGIVIQAGANSNVFAYNYILNPANIFYGDIVIHGNYPFGNLLEGNVSTSIIADYSHYINGPGHVLHRNKTVGLGILADANNLDSAIILGNHVYGDGILKGIYIVSGSFNLEEGNMLDTNFTPNNTTYTTTTSFYRHQKPSFFSPDEVWPPFGNHRNEMNTIPAQRRYSTAAYTGCNPILGLHEHHITSNHEHEVIIYDLNGNVVSTGTRDIDTNLPLGLYIVKFIDTNKAEVKKILKF